MGWLAHWRARRSARSALVTARPAPGRPSCAKDSAGYPSSSRGKTADCPAPPEPFGRPRIANDLCVAPRARCSRHLLPPAWPKPLRRGEGPRRALTSSASRRRDAEVISGTGRQRRPFGAEVLHRTHCSRNRTPRRRVLAGTGGAFQPAPAKDSAGTGDVFQPGPATNISRDRRQSLAGTGEGF